MNPIQYNKDGTITVLKTGKYLISGKLNRNPIEIILKENNIYTLPEAAKELGIKQNTLTQRIRRGGFEYPILKIGGMWLVVLPKDI